MRKHSRNEVELVIWRAVGASPAEVWTLVFADAAEWLEFMQGTARTLRFRIAQGLPVWEVFHFDEAQPASPFGCIFLDPPFWVSLRTQTSTQKERFPAEKDRKAFTRVTVDVPESAGTLA